MQQYSSKEHIMASLKKGVRLDGRAPDEFRPLTIETGVSKTAEGSAMVRCGETMLIAGVKLSTGTPYPDTPNEGVLIVNAELLPISNPAFESGPPSIDSIEMSRVIDRGVRESKTIDVKSLCIKPSESVWLVNVDICPLNADGNLIDLGGLAAIAALKDTRLPQLKNGQPDYKAEPTNERLPVASTPIPITVVKIGDVLLVDPTQDEYDIADARLTVTTEEDGTICALQKGGDFPLMLDEVERMIDLASDKAKELRELLEKAMK